MPDYRMSVLSGRGGAYPPGGGSGSRVFSKWRKTPTTDQLLPPLSSGALKTTGNSRVQSAVQNREKFASPTRQAKSALPRTVRTNAGTYGSSRVPQTVSSPQPGQPSTARCYNHQLRPRRFLKEAVVHVREPPVPVLDLQAAQAWTGEQLDYNEEVKKHGWKMEVPGDPFGLKARCLSARLPYTVRLLDPDKPILTERKHSSRPRRNGTETYFYNTIPRMPATVDIHPEFFSELITTHRMELQRRQATAVNA